MWRFIRKRMRLLKRRNKPALLTFVMVFGVGVLAYAGYMENRRLSVDHATYTPLLHLIAQAESNNNYNAYFGNPGNSSINFTGMSVAEVLAWQADFVKQGSPSSAVGRYQILNTTLSGLVQQLGIDATQKFDRSMQDRLAIALVERRGAVAYVNDELTREEFAANLAKEWAALPKTLGDNPHKSYYASDGLNSSRVEIGELLDVVEKVDS